MTALFRFVEVDCGALHRTHSFTLYSGNPCVLRLASTFEKDVIIDLATGAMVCRKGIIEILPSRRVRCNGDTVESQADYWFESRENQAWQPLSDSRPGSVGWVAANGGLISNLRIWENVTLPSWYHARRQSDKTEQSLIHWLNALGMAPETFTEFMGALPYSIEPWQRKLAGLLRALVQMPKVLVVDGALFEDIEIRMAHQWIAALESFAAQERAVLAVTDKEIALLAWEKIE